MAEQVFGREGAEFGRGLGFFDAIYGFAITLLIANIDLPPAAEWTDLATLLSGGLGSQLLGFVISFIVIAIFWRANTSVLAKFRAFDSAVIASNLVTAGLIVFIAFTTQGISDPEISEYPLPTAIYAVNVALAIASQGVTVEIGRARGLLEERLAPRAVRAARFDLVAQIAVFAASIPVAYLAGPNWAQLCWALLVPVGFATGRMSERAAARQA
ncbi:TMEM175 family protein [Leucobacter sp. gxy201]|uniref:TMEM175 family protein n=1 Tax=Leucobacter sp. gxy201 TaxID=2957200 RepID=UPI003DA1B9B8